MIVNKHQPNLGQERTVSATKIYETRQIIVNIIISKLSQVVPKFDPCQEVKYNDVGQFSNDSVI